MLRGDTQLKNNHFYKVMCITNNEIYLVKFLYFLFFYALFLLILSYAFATLLQINISFWKVYFFIISSAILFLTINFYAEKHNKKMENNLKNHHISFNQVIKSYSGKKILKELSFSINKNDFVALIGNNGCGKTTTIDLLCNLETYESGDLFVLGSKVTPHYISYKNSLGMVLSSKHLIEEFSPLEYLSFVGKFQFVDNKKIKSRSKDLIKLFELEEHQKKPIKNLSSGNKMKVSLSAALIHNPQILVLDEPFINLDVKTIQSLTNILKNFKGKKTLLITSHNLDLVADLCDNFLIMEDGQVLTELKKEENLSSNDLKEKIKTYLTSTNHSSKQIDWLT